MSFRWMVPVFLLVGLTTTSVGRTWQDAKTGQTFEADFVSADATYVFVSAEGKSFKLPRARLDEDSRVFVDSFLERRRAVASTNTANQSDRFDEIRKLPSPIPAVGLAHPDYADVDTALLAFMQEKGIPLLNFAVSDQGEVIHDRAFGWDDADLRRPAIPGRSMRLASLTKPLVTATVQTLIENGKLTADTRVYDFMNYAALAPKSVDPRWSDITVQHLLDHKGGWDREANRDWTYETEMIADDLGVRLNRLDGPDMVEWYLGHPLDFDPGEKYAYANIGYIILMRVIERASGQTFLEYFDDQLGRLSGMTTMLVSRSDARDRHRNEAWYCLHPEYTRNERYAPLRFEAKDGSGGLACSAADYCRFLDNFTIAGARRKPGERWNYAFNGSTPGVTSRAVQLPSGLNYVVIANRRGIGRAKWSDDLQQILQKELAKIPEKK